MESLIDTLSLLPAKARRSTTFGRGTKFSAWQSLKRMVSALKLGSATLSRRGKTVHFGRIHTAFRTVTMRNS